MKKQSGFTLVELMVTLSVAAVLLTIGVPSFIQTIRNNSTAVQVNQLVTSLHLARSEAVKRAMQVTVARSGAQWEDGWTIFTDQDGDGVLDAGDGDTELRIYTALRNGYTLRTGANIDEWVAYLPTGVSRGNGGPNDTFRLCADDQDTATGRSIVINIVGRVRLEVGTELCP